MIAVPGAGVHHFWLLGYQFSPRLADIEKARVATYHHSNTGLIVLHRDDLPRGAGSLKQGTVGAVELLRAPGRAIARGEFRALREPDEGHSAPPMLG